MSGAVPDTVDTTVGYTDIVSTTFMEFTFYRGREEIKIVVYRRHK